MSTRDRRIGNPLWVRERMHEDVGSSLITICVNIFSLEEYRRMFLRVAS